MEICGNQLDDDCTNGGLCQPNCADADQDGFGQGADYWGLDCDDRNTRINPYQSGAEITLTKIAAVVTSHRWTVLIEIEMVMGSAQVASVDCNDADPNVNAGAVEIINDRIDQDCDGRDLETLNLCDDPDQDGYGTGTGCYGLDCDQADPRVTADVKRSVVMA